MGGGEGGIDGYLVGKKSEFVKVGYDNRKILRWDRYNTTLLSLPSDSVPL